MLPKLGRRSAGAVDRLAAVDLAGDAAARTVGDIPHQQPEQREHDGDGDDADARIRR